MNKELHGIKPEGLDRLAKYIMLLMEIDRREKKKHKLAKASFYNFIKRRKRHAYGLKLTSKLIDLKVPLVKQARQ